MEGSLEWSWCVTDDSIQRRCILMVILSFSSLHRPSIGFLLVYTRILPINLGRLSYSTAVLPHTQPTPQQPQPPPQLLFELRDILLQTFRTEFDAAAIRKDEQAVSRFFRLWPGIGAEEEGLEAYGDFVVGLVKGRSPNAGKRQSFPRLFEGPIS